MTRLFFSFLFATLAGVAGAADGSALEIGGLSVGNGGWKLSLGAEFPGAKGALAREDADDGPRLRMSADFSGGGNYVGMGLALPAPLDADELDIAVKGTASAFWLRLGDSAGQSFQQSVSLDSGDAWRKIAFREFGNPNRKDIVHWGGPDDGVWRGPLKSVMLILHNSNVKPGKDVLLVKSVSVKLAASAQDGGARGTESVCLGDFSRGAGGWKLTLGSEFPGAQGSLSCEKTDDAGAGHALKLAGDFSNGGRYVGAGLQLPSPLFIEELDLLVKSSLPSFALRITDAQGQTFQQNVALASKGASWQELSLKEFGSPARKDIFHWGGANDGVWRGPAKSMCLLMNSNGKSGNEILFGRIDAKVRWSYPELEPVGAPLSFYVKPGWKSRLEWRLSGGVASAGELAYDIVDYQGAFAGEGCASLSDDGKSASAEIQVPKGYFEIVFRKIGCQSFGVVSLPEVSAPKDPFYCVDGGFGFFPVGGDGRLRRSFLDVLARCGISMQRERLRVSLKEMEEGSFKWGADAKDFRKEAAERGVKILENFCHAGGQLSAPGNPYPKSLFGFAKSWEMFQEGFGPECGGAELWNEPDIFAGGMLPGDTYMALLRAAKYVSSKSGGSWPLCGGVFNHVPKSAFDTYAISGLFDVADALVYHDYYGASPGGSGERAEWLAGQYREWAKDYGREGIPIWMGEGGNAWTRGPSRPPRSEDAACAMSLAVKAVECRAAGNARHFPFFLIYFDENKVNWGMHGRESTPLRIMAAYAANVRALSGSRYAGDLMLADAASVKRARVFQSANPEEMLAVVCMKSCDAGASVKLPFQPLRAEGIDGRPLPAGERVLVPDGVAYVFGKRADFEGRIDRDTAAAKLLKMASSGDSMARPAPSPLVLMPCVAPEQAGTSPKGYAPRNLESCSMSATLCNLSKEEMSYSFEVSAPEGVEVKAGGSLSGKVGPESSVPLVWTFDLSKAFAKQGRPVDISVRRPGARTPDWGFRMIHPETGVAHRMDSLDKGFPPDLKPDSSWRELGSEDYVPFGFVIYDGKSKVWARCSWSEKLFGADVIVEKEGFYQKEEGEATWKGDSVQLAFNDRSAGGSGFTELCAALTAKGPQIYRHHSASKDRKTGLMDPSSVKIWRQGGRTLYSFRLPTEEIGLPELKPGMAVGFSLLVNFNDGLSRTGCFHWGDGIAAAKSPAEYCSIKLVE